MARYGWAMRWAEREDRERLARQVKRWERAWNDDPGLLRDRERARFAAARYVLNLGSLPGLPNITK